MISDWKPKNCRGVAFLSDEKWGACFGLNMVNWEMQASLDRGAKTDAEMSALAAKLKRPVALFSVDPVSGEREPYLIVTPEGCDDLPPVDLDDYRVKALS